MSELWLDFFLAAFHHLIVFGIFAVLAMELVYARLGMSAEAVHRVAAVDRLYGLLAGLILIVGFSRAIWGLKGWDYYATNPLFWVKISLFVIVGAISVVPTMNFLRWSGRLKRDPAALPSTAEVKANRFWLHIETGVLFLIPIVAAAMARGLRTEDAAIPAEPAQPPGAGIHA
jgi:putative membrane protein